MLRIEADKTMLGAATLLVGWRTISRDYFRNDPPSPLEETIRDIALASGVPAGPEVVLPIGAVERTYARMAGRAGLPGDPRVAATVLLLRELMHHLQIDRVVIRAD